MNESILTFLSRKEEETIVKQKHRNKNEGEKETEINERGKKEKLITIQHVIISDPE